MAHNSKMPRILITGTNGQIGFELTRSLALLGGIVAVTREDFDLSNQEALLEQLDIIKPDIIVNPAAYTAVDKAETDQANAKAINVSAPKTMAAWVQKNNALLVHYSTDYVFDGTKDGSYIETDTVNPQSVYGSTKNDGEAAIRQHTANHMILRTSWVFGAFGNNFLKTMLRLMQTRDTLNVVNDQFGAPTSAALIADTTAQMIAHYLRTADKSTYPAFGTYHLTASGTTNWHGYAQYIGQLAQQHGVELKVAPDAIGGIPSSDYPTPAKRPNNSKLNCQKLEDTFHIKLPHWQEGVKYVFQLIK